MKKLFLLLVFTSVFISGRVSFAQGPFAPDDGNQGSTAIYEDSSTIQSWAAGIQLTRGWVQISDTSVYAGGSNKASWGYPAAALGSAQATSNNVVSLGDSGIAILTFDRPIANGSGPDFCVYENGFYTPAGQTQSAFLELGFVEVSSDGTHFVRFPSVSLTQDTLQVASFGTLNSTNIYNLAGKFNLTYGTPFDLDDIKDSTGIDLNNIRFVKVVDVVGDILAPYASRDSKGNIVNDPYPTPYTSCGFDLDAIGLINGGQPYVISTLDELALLKDTFWMHPMSDTAFTSGLAVFSSYVDIYGEINGFTYSNQTNDTTPGYTNEYSAITAGGMYATDSGGTNYSVAYVNPYAQAPQIHFTDNNSHKVSGFYVTNNTYAYLSMKNGDSFENKFSNTNKDWFKLSIWGLTADSTITDTISFYLADFRFKDSTNDYIANTWRWVDLYSLGMVKDLYFSLSSSQNGMFGMNTPAYFCLGNLTVLPAAQPVLLNKIADVSVKMNANPLSVVLDNVFSTYDTTGLKLAVSSNTDSGLVQTKLAGTNLTLSFATNKVGVSRIEISATQNNITVTDTFNVTVSNTLDINNVYISNTGNTKVYPNPFTSTLSIECNENSQIMMFDMVGRMIQEQIANSNFILLPTDDLIPGYYLLKIVSNSDIQTIKVLKQ